jgi:L-fuconolactonase
MGEDRIVIDFPIVDAHLHLWDPTLLAYPWLVDKPLHNKPFLPADFRKACGPVQVAKMVFLQSECRPDQARQEAEWVTSMAREDPRIAAIVPWAPLDKGEAVRDELEFLCENPLVKGVRQIIQYQPDLNFCLRPEFIRGVQSLSDLDLSFDICVTHFHLENTIQFARNCPDVRLILDHIGKPDIKARLYDPWKRHLRSLAEIPNVCCKISGLVKEADVHHWSPDDLRPYIDHVMACFGFERTMFGGDWPLTLPACEYPVWVRTLADALAGCSDHEFRKLFHDNAVSFYRLDD